MSRSLLLSLAVAVGFVGLSSTVEALGPADAPPLPPPDPEVYETVEVSTVQELADACWNLESGQAIVIAPGDYDLADHDFPNGQDGRLTVGRFGATPISDIQIRGATGDPADVVIFGAGMGDVEGADIVPHGFQIFTATDVVIADLTVHSVYFHAVAIQNDQGATRVTLRNLRLRDAGQQIVKASTGGGLGAEDVVIEYSELFSTDGVPAHPEGSPPNSCYTNAIDAFGGRSWTIRDNLIRDIVCQDGSLAGPAILMWGGASDTVVERNTILSSSRGISLGLVASSDHTGGIVRNNFVRWDPAATYAVDVPIYTVSPDTRILHNTALTRGNYPSAIEIRFAGATGVVARGNLTDAAIVERDGASGSVIADNLTSAVPGWFVDEAIGDLHLLASATEAIDQVAVLANAADDFDAVPRGGLADLGADELGGPEVVFADGFETGDTSAWVGRALHRLRGEAGRERGRPGRGRGTSGRRDRLSEAGRLRSG